MDPQKRRARARRRAKTMRLRRMGVPCTGSKWGFDPLEIHRRNDGLTPGDVMSARKQARYSAPLT